MSTVTETMEDEPLSVAAVISSNAAESLDEEMASDVAEAEAEEEEE